MVPRLGTKSQVAKPSESFVTPTPRAIRKLRRERCGFISLTRPLTADTHAEAVTLMVRGRNTRDIQLPAYQWKARALHPLAATTAPEVGRMKARCTVSRMDAGTRSIGMLVSWQISSSSSQRRASRRLAHKQEAGY